VLQAQWLDLLALLVRGHTQVLLPQLVLDQEMLGLILIQAVFLFIMMDTGLKLVLHQLVQQDHKELPALLVRKELQDQQVPQAQELLDYRGG
jgi:hypothetical protein